MQLVNQTKNTVLAKELIIADSFLGRLKGLLGRKGLGSDQAMLLESCNSIHTFFMQFDIDILFLDKHNRVIKAIRGLKPNRATSTYWNCRRVIELPAGKIDLAKTQANDQLVIAG